MTLHIAARSMPGKTLLFVAAVFLIGATYWMYIESPTLSELSDVSTLRGWIAQLGPWGPVAVIGLMTLAILVSPIPSAPIAVTAGAAYGHYWGTLYVITGAEIGALGAFVLARFVGYEVLHGWFGDRLSKGWLGSQNALTILVFVSRLLPFISFDIVSYVAGLSVIAFWRFAIATLAGIVPASFLLAHFGDEMATGEVERIMFSVLLLGAITLLPVGYRLLRGRRRHQRHSPTDEN